MLRSKERRKSPNQSESLEAGVRKTNSGLFKIEEIKFNIQN